ncbi:MAG: YwqG family protein [Cyanobacteria bacterium P01_D01_bin.128]
MQPDAIALSPSLEPYRARIEATLASYVQIDVHPSDTTLPWESKFGGTPYLPKAIEYPKSAGGGYLHLLAQLNFADIPPLDAFPERGILQIFIDASDDLYGLNFDTPTDQSRFRMCYFPEVNTAIEKLVTRFDFLPEPEYHPINGAYSLSFSHRSAPVSPEDYRFNQLMGSDFDDLLEDEACYDEYWELSRCEGHKIGGYPSFTQSDPRCSLPKIDSPDVLLLQIDTDEIHDIMWGDAGVGNFFISARDLQRLDFSRTLYSWDCA